MPRKTVGSHFLQQPLEPPSTHTQSPPHFSSFELTDTGVIPLITKINEMDNTKKTSYVPMMSYVPMESFCKNMLQLNVAILRQIPLTFFPI